jgi:imidazolonepropionase-like amidohydrolase
MSETLLIESEEIRTYSDQGILKNGEILIKDGKILEVGNDISVPAGTKKISGNIVTPGLIDAHTHLGLYPLESTDTQPSGADSSDLIAPHLRVVDGLNPYDKGFKDAINAGITTVVVSAGSPMSWGGMVEAITIMPGQNAIMKTNGFMINESSSLKMAVGDHPKRFLDSLNKPPNTRMGILSLIRAYLEKTQRYIETEENLESEKERAKLDAFLPLLKKEYPAHIHVHTANDILSILRIMKEYDFNSVIIHGTESHLIADQLSDVNVPVVFGPMIFPRRGRELANLTNRTPAVLEEKNILFAITTDHPCTPIQYLSINAGLAEAEGLKDGLKTITANAAKIAGIWDRLGSIEPGKDADIAIFDGDPLEIGTKVQYTLIDGQIEYVRE